MSRRDFLSIALPAVLPAASRQDLIVPVQIVLDRKAALTPEQLRRFRSHIWPEAVRDFGRCGVRLESRFHEGEVGRPGGREPVLSGLAHGAINVVITDRLPAEWDHGLALSGVATWYRGHCLCMIALNRAHGHEIPLLSVNTCTHELLHVLLGDIFDRRPARLAGTLRELRVDWFASRLWLLQDGRRVRTAAEKCLQRLSV